MSSISCIRPANTWCNKSIGTLCAATVEPPCGGGKCPSVREWPDGSVAVGYVVDKDAHFRFSKFSWPALGWDREVAVTSSGDVLCFRFDRDEFTGRILGVLTRDVASVPTLYTTFSDDLGQTWSAPV